MLLIGNNITKTINICSKILKTDVDDSNAQHGSRWLKVFKIDEKAQNYSLLKLDQEDLNVKIYLQPNFGKIAVDKCLITIIV